LKKTLQSGATDRWLAFPVGGTNPAFWAINPQVQYDSWLTVGVVDGIAAEISTAAIDFTAWTEQQQPIRTTSGAVQFLNPTHGPQNIAGSPVTVGQLTLPASQSWVSTHAMLPLLVTFGIYSMVIDCMRSQSASMNLKGKDTSGNDWQLDGITFVMCNGATCQGGGHRRTQLSEMQSGPCL